MTKKLIILLAIAICCVAVGMGCSKNNENTQSKVKNPILTINNQHDTKPLGTLATPDTGKIYVNIGVKFNGIIGNKLNVMPELSDSGNLIGSYGLIYYDSNILKNKTIVKFYNDVVLKSKCNYVILVNAQNPKQGISISSSGALSKGTLNKIDHNYEIINSTELANIDFNSKTFSWKNS